MNGASRNKEEPKPYRSMFWCFVPETSNVAISNVNAVGPLPLWWRNQVSSQFREFPELAHAQQLCWHLWNEWSEFPEELASGEAHIRVNNLLVEMILSPQELASIYRQWSIFQIQHVNILSYLEKRLFYSRNQFPKYYQVDNYTCELEGGIWNMTSRTMFNEIM